MTNRNLCIAASLCCFLGGGLPAQRPSAFGVTAGINLASVSGSAEDASNRTGLRLGVFMIRTLVPGVQLQPEAVFTSKGAAYDNVDLVINYLQVPVLIRVELPTASAGLVPYGVIGPALALRIGCDLRASNGDTVECGPNSTGRVHHGPEHHPGRRSTIRRHGRQRALRPRSDQHQRGRERREHRDDYDRVSYALSRR